MSFPALSCVSSDAANGPWPRGATERTFLVAGVAGIKQVFAAVRCSDSMNWAAHDPGASRQSDNGRISISKSSLYRPCRRGHERHSYPAARQRRCRNRLRRSHLSADLAGCWLVKNSRAERLMRRRIFQTTPILSSSARTRGWFRARMMRWRRLSRAPRDPEGRKFCPSPKCSRFFRVDTRTLWWRDLSARRRAFR